MKRSVLAANDPFLLRTFGADLPILLEALRVCEISYSVHDVDEDGPYNGVVDLSVDILGRILGCPSDDVWGRASDCERALKEVFGLSLWRKGPKAERARSRGFLRVSRTIETMSRWGGPLRWSYEDESDASLFGPDLIATFDEIAEAAARGETRHFLFRLDGNNSWTERNSYSSLNEALRDRHPQLDVRSMGAEIYRHKQSARPGYIALASAIVVNPRAVRLLPSSAPLIGGADNLSSWTDDGTSHRLPLTADGSDRVEAIVRFHRALRELRGVHVWCCPAATEAFVAWIPEQGPSFLPELSTFEGRQAVLFPIYQAQASLLANERSWSTDQADKYAADFDALTRLIYKDEV